MTRITGPDGTPPPERPDPKAPKTDRSEAEAFLGRVGATPSDAGAHKAERPHLSRIAAVLRQTASEGLGPRQTLERVIEQELARAHGRPPAPHMSGALAGTIEDNRALSALYRRVMSNARP
jgi:hypothetical protein